MTADLKTSLDLYRRQIDKRLEELLPNVLAGQVALDEAMRDSVLAPGKRLRPLMTLITAEDLGGRTDCAVDAGCAVEMVHAASLVLDDLPCMDNAALRRGLPAIHVGHGEDLAVLISIGVLAGAYELLAGLEAMPAEARLASVAILSKAVGVRGLVGGQFEDLRGGSGRRPVAAIAAANGLKTGSLFSAAVEIGGVVAGVRDGTKIRLRDFAGELGHAFQLLDDLLDAGANPLAIGKDVGKDKGKSTIVSMLGHAPVRRRIARHLENAHGSLTEIFGRNSRMHALVEMIFTQSLGENLGQGLGAVAPNDLASPEDHRLGELGQEIGAR